MMRSATGSGPILVAVAIALAAARRFSWVIKLKVWPVSRYGRYAAWCKDGGANVVCSEPPLLRDVPGADENRERKIPPTQERSHDPEIVPVAVVKCQYDLPRIETPPESQGLKR